MKNAAEELNTSILSECRVLLVEDSLENQNLVSNFLKQAGADVSLSDNGQHAFDLALEAHTQGFPFDIILIEMQLPVLDGCVVTKKLRAAGFRGPVIALTACETSYSRQKCTESGCDDYLIKPVDPTQLINLMSLYLSQLKQKKQFNRAAKVFLNLDG
tara:strand:+ start:38253 stop:38726 length:474 start_codon:yes stop_codon:yes gene_type:complete